MPDGSLSPLAFEPAPRQSTTGIASVAGSINLILPSPEPPLVFSQLWVQTVPAGKPLLPWRLTVARALPRHMDCGRDSMPHDSS